VKYILIIGDGIKMENLTNEQMNTELCYLMAKDVRNGALIAVLKAENSDLKGRLAGITKLVKEML
jgi:hypothetical protein